MAVGIPPTGLLVEKCVLVRRRALANAGSPALVAPPGAGKTTRGAAP